MDGHTLPFNIDSLSWGYDMTTNSTDTLGGRVIQVLNVKVQGMTMEGMAGSRKNIVVLYALCKQAMDKHVETERPVRLIVPSRDWQFDVYITSFPSVGWDLKTVGYKYRISLDVDEDFGSLTEKVKSSEIKRMARGMGYFQHKWRGGAPGDDPAAPDYIPPEDPDDVAAAADDNGQISGSLAGGGSYIGRL